MNMPIFEGNFCIHVCGSDAKFTPIDTRHQIYAQLVDNQDIKDTGHDYTPCGAVGRWTPIIGGSAQKISALLSYFHVIV
jgi:hypothetical protein